MINWFKNILKKKTNPNRDSTFDSVYKSGDIMFAFECGGTKYYQYSTETKIPALRAFAAMDVYNEMEQRIESNYLRELFESIMTLCNKGEIGKIYAITESAALRLDNLTNVDLIYKLGTVLYFDETENPFNYDHSYAFSKRLKWMSHNLEDFFLKTPLTDYLPSFNQSQINLEEFTNLERKEKLRHLKVFSRILQESENKVGESGSLKLWMETLENMTH